MKWLLILSLIFCSLWSSATHIVGGELYYNYQGNDDYLVTLKMYRDCGPSNTNGTGYDPTAAISVYDNGTLINTYYFTFPGAAQLPVVINNPCLVAPPNICVEEAVYSQVIHLPPSSSGYDIIYQRCCRNPTILNIQNPSDYGATWYAHIPASPNNQNSSPHFSNLPPLAMCIGDNMSFDHSATDPDGDSLVYGLYTPLDGGTTTNPAPDPAMPPPFSTVVWNTGYSLSYPIDAAPAFQIDPQTGLLTGTPTTAGQYVFAVGVKEYRNGVLLSKTIRDFQINVTNCSPVVIASIPAQTSYCDGTTVNFLNNSQGASAYYWDFGDPTSNNDNSTLATPSWTYQDTGTYTIMLIANPGWPCADTAFTDYQVNLPVSAQIIPVPDQCLGNNSFDFQAGGNYSANATFNWNFGSNATPASSTAQSPTGVVYNSSGTGQVILSINDDNCTASDTIDVNILSMPVASITPQSQFCNGQSVQFTDNSQSAVSWNWDFGDGQTSMLQNPQYTYLDTGTYSVTLVVMNAFGCTDTTTTNWAVYPMLQAQIQPVADQCITNNSFQFVAGGSFDASAAFLWDFDDNAGLSGSNAQNPPAVSYSSYGNYTVTLQIEQYGCLSTATQSFKVYPEPELAFSLRAKDGCAPFKVQFNDESFAWTSIYYEWDFGDGQGSTLADPEHVYQYPGNYTVSLLIYTESGCVDTLWQVMPGLVTVHESPTVSFSATPAMVPELEALVYFSDRSWGADSTWYLFGDGESSHLSNVWHDYNEAGTYTVEHWASNAWGCTDSARDEVIVVPNYIPNAFTPGNASVGHNDVFQPISWPGMEPAAFKMLIFNRWGALVYATENPYKGWDGRDGSGELAPQGVYVYRIDITTKADKKHRYIGHITLLK